MTGKTISEKLLSEKSGRDVRAGDYVEAEVDVMMTHDVTGPLTFEVFEDVTGDDPRTRRSGQHRHHDRPPRAGRRRRGREQPQHRPGVRRHVRRPAVRRGRRHLSPGARRGGVRLPGRPGDRCGLALDHLRRRRRLRHRRRLHRPRDDARDRRAVVPGAGDAGSRSKATSPTACTRRTSS